MLVRDYLLQVDLRGSAGAWYLVFQLLLALVVALWSESFIAQIYLLILIGEFTFHQPRVRAILFTAAVYLLVLLSIAISRRFPPFWEIAYLLPRIIDYLAVFGMSLLARIAFQQKNQLSRDNELLRQASLELAERAKWQERTRISREIHDAVGHTLTSALIGLQTASRAIEKNNGSLAVEMVERTRANILTGLNEVRSSVRLLRDSLPAQSFIPELTRLIEETMLHTGVAIAHEIDRTIPDLPPMVEITIYRSLQEGLTNGIRHGASTSFHFSLTRRGRQLRFVLSDNGKAAFPIVPGFGLQAMEERAAEVGGKLTLSKREPEGGLTLEITIPLPELTERREDIV